MARRYPNRVYMDWAAPYETSREQRFPFGQIMELPNGSIYRYTRMGSPIGVGNKLYQSEVPDAEFDTLVVATGAVVGGTQLTITNGTTSVTENEFTEGQIVIETASGLGHVYPIKDNTLAGSGGAITTNLADGVTFQSVVTAGTHAVTLTKNPWLDVILHPAPATAMVIGIPQVIIPIAHHGWAQTHGFASCLDDGTCVIGKPVRVSETADGAVTPMDMDEASAVANGGMVGVAMTGGTTGDFVPIWLTLE